ncbi:MAG: hypothetical protein KTR20_14140 [Cellvibrionaceae bacterium]|nr:hypothetical protein [Cellvibrionaceae bacterium]
MSGAAGLISGGGGGISAAGGAAGPARSGLTNNSSFNVGGNAGIGSTSGGLNPMTLLMVGLIAMGTAVILTRGRR